MAAQKLRFTLTAFDPNPAQVTLGLESGACNVEECLGTNLTIEDYKTTPEGNPSEIYMKVTPDPIAFVMKFIDGQMTIEFKGSWSVFQQEAAAAAAAAQALVIEEPASSEICFKVHFLETDTDPVDIRLLWDFKELAKPDSSNGYIIAHQETTELGREFVIAVNHPTSGEIYCIRGAVKGDKVTIFNTDKFDMGHINLYLQFYIKNEEKIHAILDEIAANPNFEISILYKHGAFGESMNIASFTPYIIHNDKDGKPLKNRDTDDDDRVKRAREARKKAEDAGKKGTEPPADGKDWSCGRVKWELPKEEKKFRDAGKLKIPDFGRKEEGPHLQDVGKLKWGGFDADEPKEVVKEKPKVGKLNLGAFGAAATDDAPPPPKKSWKKKKAPAPES